MKLNYVFAEGKTPVNLNKALYIESQNYNHIHYINFKVDGNTIQWRYESKEKRDEEYNKILSLKGMTDITKMTSL